VFVTMLGLLASDFGYQNRLTLLQQLIDCGDVLLGRDLVCDYGKFVVYFKIFKSHDRSLEG
jgi:hypothetical protein